MPPATAPTAPPEPDRARGASATDRSARPAPADVSEHPDDHGISGVHQRYAASRSDADLVLLVQQYAPLACAVARRFRGGSTPIDDLEQVAYEALIGALRRYQPDLGIPFAGFAVVTIEGALKRHLRDTRWWLRVPRRSRDLASHLQRARELLEQDLGRAATVEEVADWLDVEVREVRQAIDAQRSCDVCSLDEAVPEDASEDRRLAVHDRDLQRAEDRTALRQAVAQLPARDRRVLDLYFARGHSQAEIGALLGVSQMQVSRELHRILAGLRSRLAPT